MRAVLVAAASFICAACSATFPIAVVTTGVPGGIMRGEGHVSMSGGTFTVGDGTLSCGGTYDGMDMSPTITVPVICNDGRKGLITATRNNAGTGGGGRFTLNDGMTGEFIFGPGARQL